MRSWPAHARKAPRIEIIPMIDVMMFLLVFFVLISLHTLPSLGLKVALPHSTNATHVDAPERVTLTLTADGDLYMNGAKASLVELTDRLRALAADHRIVVVVAGDRNARLQPLVDVLDALKRAGILSAAIIARQE